MSYFSKPNPSSTICPWCNNEVNPSMSARWDLVPWVGNRVTHFACIEAIETAARTIAHNLAIAGALCRAFLLGAWYGNESVYLMGDETPNEWSPGCGRST